MEIVAAVPSGVIWGLILVAVLVSLRFPVAGIGIYLWLDFMRPHDFDPALRAFRPMLWVGIALLVGGAWQRRKRLFEDFRRFLPLAALFAAVAVSALFSEDRAAGAAILLQVLKLTAFIWVVAGVLHTRGQWEAIVWVIAVSIGGLALYGIYEGHRLEMMEHAFHYDRVIEGPPGIHDGAYRDNNDLARIVSLSLPLWCLLAWVSRPRILRGVAAAGALLAVVGIEYTFSRGGFVAMAIGATIVAVGYLPRGRAAAFLAVFFGALFLLSPQPYVDRIATIARPLQDPAMQTRLKIWARASDDIREEPIHGHGPGVFDELYAPIPTERETEAGAQPAEEDELGKRSSHNLFLEALADLGLLGFAAFLWVIVAAVVLLWRIGRFGAARDAWNRQAAIAIGASLAAFLGASMLLSGPYRSPHYVLIALIFALERIVMGRSIDRRAP